ncbi:tRNA1Val (adenine37-N6)-methyltransferase [Filimonas zeae]|uniref:tRNA1(Val) (adenine(37)-N6)-methyltransferase n=1 Tax=Filimonas zeae TaxID=1737353 RepID=A0A917IM09_9BACT|nr:methyltransferase [Filimonas zeae]MDR6337133.1 tRNA1Val (adenine37-N6)-methyltransferase [Filimonas zeae]GGH57153.1 tRNA1(Val) (adenine(37)-N6)-methyltransferase [Filimonas zeae]
MPNGYFQFKQFTVHQEACAMKVCTDACLFGAWVVEKVKSQKGKIKKILDIGAGTGLLSLMLAQAIEADIDAVEIDEQAALQAGSNFAACPWQQRLRVHTLPVQLYGGTDNGYELVVSNPPFFENDLKSSDNKRNLALHSAALSLDELFIAAGTLAQPRAQFALLLPWHRNQEALALAHKHQWQVQAAAAVQQTPRHTPFRTMLLLSRGATQAYNAVTESIVIKDADNAYTPEFTQLLSPYYLHL